MVFHTQSTTGALKESGVALNFVVEIDVPAEDIIERISVAAVSTQQAVALITQIQSTQS